MSVQRKFIAFAVLAAFAIAALLWKRQSAPQSGPAKAPSTVAVAPAAQTPPPEPAAPPVETPLPANQSESVRVAPPTRPPSKTVQAPAQPKAEPQLRDPDARNALAMVGQDPQAELYWLDAIFDSSLPDKEREDLMEDLNEVGFADPKNLTPEDLPLIANRLRIIEELEPDLDPFMSEHLGEAYKDLVNMYAQASGQ